MSCPTEAHWRVLPLLSQLDASPSAAPDPPVLLQKQPVEIGCPPQCFGRLLSTSQTDAMGGLTVGSPASKGARRNKALHLMAVGEEGGEGGLDVRLSIGQSSTSSPKLSYPQLPILIISLFPFA